MATRNNKSLVVVESPAKARTISRILGSKYDVKASIGHVRDLPKRDLGIQIEDGFLPKYVVPKEKARTVKEIRDAAQKAGNVYLATDPDREGEAIAWHLLEAADLGALPLHRVVFHEITPEAVQEAFEHPRDIDMKLVDAQQARRVLDRLVGYRLSPFLWTKVRRGLSAGRVQSVAVRLVVEREREIQAFTQQEYWTIDAELEKPQVAPSFRARLQGHVGKRQKLEIPNETEAQRLVAILQSAAYRVLSVQTKTQPRRPAAPFITSTLQQEASRKLGFTTKRTMQIAQQLYEGLSLGAEGEVGLITYMRTDSTNVAASAQQETRAYITERFGREFLPASARVFAKKVKGAQEAHEAIRPTHVRREPEAVRRYLNNDQNRLYNLIWQRMVASQMADALFDVTTVDIEGMPSAGQNPLLLRATNTQLQFAGFRQVYIEGRDDDTEEDLGNNPLPALSEADVLRALGFFPEQHFTEPPPRFTEATLIKALEEKGIGRPSTYAPTMSTIQDRGYVEKDGRYLRPSDLGSVVNDLLVEHFQDFVDVGFTAGMEDELDDIANGDRRWQPVVQEFYNPLEKALTLAKETAPKQVETTDVQCPECGKPMLIRWGRRGRFLACSGFPECKGTLPLEGEEQEAPQQTDEQCPECSSPMVIKSGRFGRFLACSRYPECKGRKPFTVTTGVRCPRDAGELLERRSRRGRIFYGCSNYPKCDFTTWTRPLPQPCPNCGGLVTAERDNKAKCTVCNWRGGVVQQAPEPTPIA
ncbi:MAG: type I DNA topoisomerase [Chloroflexi bacterium]|nr:MAG: type I DNA topoisomerase [Chloroflexota bacterium]TMG07346.1 MAG: type I DNA topoisomerase [Chloroflexota bacterium]